MKLVLTWTIWLSVVPPIFAGAALSKTAPSKAAASETASSKNVLLRETFDGPNRLLTNEYAHWNPTDKDAVASNVWDMTSGSVFVRDGAAWSGVPDDINPNARSSNGNDSAIFRLTTRRTDFANVSISLRLFNARLSQTPRTPPQDWDGIHIFLRYESEESLYYATINRRDDLVAIKKKVPGGPSNGGTYFTLAQAPFKTPFGVWQNVRAEVRAQPNGSVQMRLFSEGRMVLEAVDTGEHGEPILTGATGLRGDNCDFRFDDFDVALLPSAPAG